MMGFLQVPGLLHASLEQGIADLSSPSALQAQLHILEAIRVRIPYGSFPTCAGPETDLTNPNIVARRNKVIAGTDPVLVDAFGCVDLFNIQPQELTHVLRAHENSCGDMDVEAALADGRIRSFKVGTPLTVATTVPDQTGVVTQSPAISKPTAVSLPPSEPNGQLSTSTALGGTSCSPDNQVVSLGPILNKAFIPAALVVGGISLAVLNRMRRTLPKESHETGDSPVAKDVSNPDEGHG
jgi:hypothetical protein